MTQTQEKIEQFQEMVGVDVSYNFETQVASAILYLTQSLKAHFLDNETAVNYATHVFAQMLDDLAEMLEKAQFVN